MSFFKDVADIANQGVFARMGLPPIKGSFESEIARLSAKFDEVMRNAPMPDKPEYVMTTTQNKED